MTFAEINAVLVETALASTAAMVLVLLVRRPLRLRFGAGVAYAAWLLVPAALLAVLLPAAVVPAPPAMGPAIAGVSTELMANGAAMADRAWLLSAGWLAGLLVTGCWFGWRQRRFRRSMGELRRRGDGT